MDNAEKLLSEPRTSKRHYVMLLIVALLFGGLFYTGYQPWKDRQNRLLASTTKPGEIVVCTVKAVRASPTS